MKKLSLILAIIMNIHLFVPTVMADSYKLIIPSVGDDVNLIVYEDFENENLSKWTWWDGQSKDPEILQCFDDTNSTKAINIVDYNYYLENNVYSNYTLELNFKCSNYDSWPAIRFNKKGNKAAQIYISQSSQICVEGADGWIGSADYDFSELNGKWVYFKMEAYGDNLKFYVNDKENPALDITDPQLNSSGGIGFVGTGNFIDNMMLSRKKRDLPVPTLDESSEKLIAQPDFSHKDEKEWQTTGGSPEFVEDKGETVYKVSEYDMFLPEILSKKRNYTVEFNVKIDYADNNGNLGNSYPGIYFRTENNKKYNLYANTNNTESFTVESVDKNVATGYWSNDASGFLQEENDWAYMKIEMLSDNIKIYYMDKETPIIEIDKDSIDKQGIAENSIPAYGGITFVNGGASKYYIKNLLVKENKEEKNISQKPEISDENETILFQDYENEINGFTSTEGEVNAVNENNNNVLPINGTITSTNKEFYNFTMEFNMKADFDFDASITTITFRNSQSKKYELIFNNLLPQQQIILKRGYSKLKTLNKWIIDDSNVWNHIKIDVKENNIKVYMNDMNDPIINYNDLAPIIVPGSIAFVGGTNTTIDNLYVYTNEKFKPIIINNANITTVESGEKTTVNLNTNVTNITDKKIDAILLTTVFDGEKLKAANAKPISLASNPTDGRDRISSEFSSGITFDTFAGYIVKSFIINNFSDLNILSDSFSYNDFTIDYSINKGINESAQISADIIPNDVGMEVTGSLNAEIQKSILLIVTKDKTLNSNNFQNIENIAQIPNTNLDGSFNKQFELNGGEGEYYINICSDRDILSKQLTYMNISHESITRFIDLLNNSTSNELQKFLLNSENYLIAKKLGMKIDEYNLITQEKNRVALCADFIMNKDGEFTESNIAKQFNKSLLLYFIKDSNDIQTFKKRFEIDFENYGLNEDTKNMYLSLSDEVKNETMIGYMKNVQDCNNLEEFRSCLKPAIILASIFKSNYTQIEDLVIEYKNTLDVDTSLFSKITNKTKKTQFFKALNSTRTFSATEFQKLFNDEYKKAAEVKNESSGSSGSGGGGGGASIGSVNPYKSVLNQAAPVINPNNSANVTFSDLSENHWSYKAVQTLCKKNIISGFEDNTFKPDAEITRAEFSKLIVSAFELYHENSEVTFDDVNKDLWSYKYIASAKKAGIVNGKTDSIFAPEDKITRQEMASIFYRVIASKKLSYSVLKSVEFADINNAAEYSREAICYLASIGAVSGLSENKFAPEKTATRAEASNIIYYLTEGYKYE